MGHGLFPCWRQAKHQAPHPALRLFVGEPLECQNPSEQLNERPVLANHAGVGRVEGGVLKATEIGMHMRNGRLRQPFWGMSVTG